MKIRNILQLLFIAIIIVSCNNNAKETKTKVSTDIHKKEAHWAYKGEMGPEHWKEIEKNSDCDGKFQSPINIVNTKKDESLKPLEITYSDNTKIHDVINNGHSIQYNFEKGDYITLDGKKYKLVQFHFHEPAEHTINGIRYPMVIHLVHVSDIGEYAVLAVMAEEGENSKAFDFLESFLPLEEGMKKEVNLPFDMNDNLPENKGYYNYTGSLTTPPCTENVQWFIFKQPITVSLEQVLKLRALMPLNNYRNEQLINGRVIKASKF